MVSLSFTSSPHTAPKRPSYAPPLSKPALSIPKFLIVPVTAPNSPLVSSFSLARMFKFEILCPAPSNTPEELLSVVAATVDALLLNSALAAMGVQSISLGIAISAFSTPLAERSCSANSAWMLSPLTRAANQNSCPALDIS